MKKRLLSMILALGMMLTILPVNAITAWAADDKSGACGDGLTYTMIQNDDGTDTYTLAITGTGAMTDYSYSSGYKPVPWYAERDKITKLTIAGATSIGKSAFKDCHSLADVTISGSVTSIGEQAFESCHALTNTSISNILKEATSIGEGAFRGCTSLTSVEIPESVTSIDVAAFGQCSNLTSVKILGAITSIAASTFINCGKLNNFNIPVSVTSIGDWAFARCSGLANIKIPEKVTSIGNHAFENCTFLTTIKIPDSVTSIGEKAFNGCSSLRQVDLPSVIPTISKGAFNNVNTHYYYPGYRSDFVSQAQKKIATGIIGMESPTYSLVHCYSDVSFDANGGSFADGGTQKKVEKIWSATKLTQEQVDSIGMPKQAGKIFLGWNTTSNATTTINPISDYVVDGKIYYAVYKDAVPATVTISGPTDNTVKAGEGSDVFTVAANKGDTDAAKAKFDFAGGKVQYRTGDTEEWLDLTSNELNIDDLTGKQFRVVPDADAVTGQKALTVKLMDASGNDIDGATASTAFAVTARKPAEVTITGLDNTTVKAGEAKEFTVSVTPNDDTIDNVTFGTTSGEVQWSNDGGKTWTTVPGDVAYSGLTGKKFRVVPAADAANGTVTVTVIAKKADGTEAAKKDASFTVTKKEEPVIPGGGSTGGGENPGENPGGNPGSGSTKPEQETPKRKLEIADGTLTSVMVKDENGNLKDITDTITKDLDGKYEIPVGAKVTITAKDAPEGMKFGEWSISDKTLLGNPDVPYTEKDLIFTMPDNPDGVKLSVVYLEESIGEEPNLVEKGALAGTVVVGSAALLYQGHMLGTELYLRYLLPHGAVIPQNRAELAVLLWQDAESPEPVSTTLYSDISDEDSAIQQAARWAVENDLMEQLDADEHPDHFDPFVPVTFSDSIRAWKKAQELKKSVH